MFPDEIQTDPGNCDLRIAYAASLAGSERYPEALHQISLVQDLSGTVSDDGMLLMREILAELYVQSDDLIIRLAGDDPVTLSRLFHEKARRLDTFRMRTMAISGCRRLLEIRSDSPLVRERQADALHLLGDLEGDENRYEESCRVYESLLAADPDHARWLAEEGMVLNNLSRFREAKEILFRAVERDPGNGTAYSALCWCLSGLNEGEAALSMGDRAVQLTPDEWGAWNNRGLARVAVGDLVNAVDDFRQALRCRPDEPIAHRNLCGTLAEIGDEEVYGATGEYLIRFGDPGREGSEPENSDLFPGNGRKGPVITGYLEGYW